MKESERFSEEHRTIVMMGDLLREHMREGEVWITNAMPRDIITYIRAFNEGRKYEDVRNLDIAYGRKGEPLKDMVAIVGVPVQKEAPTK